MFLNYLTIAIRHFWANKAYVIANIVGLAVAMAICIIGYYHFAYNFEFNDNYKSSTGNIYHIHSHSTFEGRKFEHGVVPFALVKMLKSDVPEIKTIRYFTDRFSGAIRLKIKDQYFKEPIFYADSGFFQAFKHDFIYGNETAFQDRSAIVLTERKAKKYFGNENPMGKTISLIYNDKRKDFIVKGVIKEQHLNSSFFLDHVIRFENFIDLAAIDESSWSHWIDIDAFIEVQDEKNVAAMRQLLPSYKKIYNEFHKNQPIDSLSLVSFSELKHIELASSSTNRAHSKRFITMILTIAFLILLIACFNFTNTSIALAGTRIKEISLRKVMGSQRKHLITQFLLEHFIISLVAALLSIALADFFTPLYFNMWQVESMEGFDISIKTYIVPFLIFMTFVTALLSGAYPAFYISNLKTADALRKNIKLKGGNWFTYTLLAIQLIITVVGLGTGIVFAQNMDFIVSSNKGYAMENIISIPMGGTEMREFDLFKSKILQNPNIKAVSGTVQHISWGSWEEKTKFEDKEIKAFMLPTGDKYLETMGVKLIEGRFFNPNDYNDTYAVILNEKYLQTAGITNVLSKSISIYERPFKIVGIVGNFRQHGASANVRPMVITLKKTGYLVMAVQTNNAKLNEVNTFLEKTWNEIFPNKPYDGSPQLKSMDGEKKIFGIMRSIFISVSVISMVLSFIGLYVLISLIINKKTNEIGIRKIMGAPIQNIIFILGRNFIYIFSIAALVGSFLGLQLAKVLFDAVFKFENHVEITPSVYVFSICYYDFSCRYY